MNKHRTKLVDERVQKDYARITAPMYYLISALLAVSLVVKLILRQTPGMYIVEVLALILPFIYFVMASQVKGILFIKYKDEAVVDFRRTIRARCFSFSFFICVFGATIIFFIYNEQLTWLNTLPYFLIWMVPSIIITVRATKKGLILAWNSKQTQSIFFKNYKFRIFFASLFMGIFMVVIIPLNDHRPVTFNFPDTIFQFLFSAGFWGFFVFFLMKKLYMKNEKNADNEAAIAEALEDSLKENKNEK